MCLYITATPSELKKNVINNKTKGILNKCIKDMNLIRNKN